MSIEVLYGKCNKCNNKGIVKEIERIKQMEDD